MTRRSTTLLANPSFLAHLLWATGGFATAVLVLAAAAVFLPLFQRFDEGATSPDEVIRLTGRILDLHASFWPVALLAFGATLMTTWLLYTRMSEPLVRFVAAFRAVARGARPELVVIRATDYVQAECAELNAMLAALRERAGAQSVSLERVAEQAAQIAERASASGDAQLVALADALEAECKFLRGAGAIE